MGSQRRETSFHLVVIMAATEPRDLEGWRRLSCAEVRTSYEQRYEGWKAQVTDSKEGSMMCGGAVRQLRVNIPPCHVLHFKGQGK